jgi:hypothetical protein
MTYVRACGRCRIRRTEIAYIAEDEKVSIIGVFHGGRDYEAEQQPEDRKGC